MAQSYDSDIILTVGLDVDDIADSAKKIKGLISNALDAGIPSANELAKSYNNLQVQTSKLIQKQAELQAKLKNLKTSSLPYTKDQKTQLADLTTQAKQLSSNKKFLQEALDSYTMNGKYAPDGQLKDYPQKIAEIDQQLQKIGASIKTINSDAKNLQDTKIQKINAELADTVNKLSQAVQKQRELGQEVGKAFGPTNAFNRNIKALNTGNKHKDGILGKFQITKKDMQINDVEAIQKKYEEIQSRLDSMSKSKRDKLYADHPEIEKAVNHLKELIATYEGLRIAKENAAKKDSGVSKEDKAKISRQESVAATNVVKGAQHLNDVATPVFNQEDLQAKVQSVSKSIMKTFSQLGQAVAGQMMQIYQKIANVLINLGKKAVGTVVSAFKSLGGAISSAGAKLAGFAKNLLKVASSPVVNRLTAIRDKILSIGKASKSNNNVWKNGWRTILQYILGFRTMYFLVHRLRQYVGTGISEFSRVSSEVNQALSGIVSALATLQHSLGSAFAPIATTILPLLTKLAKTLNYVTNVIGMFLAALTGAKTYKMAKPVVKDYAASLKSTQNFQKSVENQEKKTTKAAEKAKKALDGQLMSFDEINKLQDKNTSDSGSGGGGVDDNAPWEYEDVEIPDWIDEFVKEFNSRDWSKIGERVAQALDTVVQAFNKNYRRFSKAIDLWTDRLSSFINGFFGYKKLFVDLGRAIANGLNLITQAIDQFVKKTDWVNIGDSIGRMLKEAVMKSNWTNLGKVLSDKLYVIAQTLHGFLEQWPKTMFETLGTKLGEMINAAFNNVPWDQFIPDLVELGTGILAAINSAIEEIQFGSMIHTLSLAIQHANWSDLWAEIDRFLADMASSNFLQIGADIGKAIDAVFGSIPWDTMIPNVVNIAIGIVQGIDSAIQNINFEETIDKIITGLENAPWDKLFQSISQLVSNLMSRVGQSLPTLIPRLVEDLGNFLTDIANTLTTMKPKFDEFVSNIKEGIANADWTKLVNAISEISGDILVFGSELLLAIVEGFTQATANGNMDFSQAADNIKSALTTAMSTILYTWDEIKEPLFQALDGVLDTISPYVAPILNDIADFLFKSLGSYIENVGLPGFWAVAKLALFAALPQIGTTLLGKVVGWLGGEFVKGLLKKITGDVIPKVAGGEGLGKVATVVGNTLKTIGTKGAGAVKAVGATLKGGISTVASGMSSTAVAGVAAFDVAITGYDVAKLVEVHKGFEKANDEHKQAVENYKNNLVKVYEAGGAEALEKVTGGTRDLQQALDEADKQFEETPHNMWEGFKGGIDEYFGSGEGGGLFGLIGDAFTEMVDSVKGLLGIHSPSTVFHDIGANLIDGLLGGIQDTWKNISEFFGPAIDAIKDKVGDAWEKVKTTTSETWEKVKAGVSEPFDKAKEAVLDAKEKIKDGIDKSWTKVKDITGPIWNGLKDTINTAMTNVKTAVGTKGKDVELAMQKVWDTVKSEMKTKWNTIVSQVGTLMSNLKQGFQNKVEQFKSIGSNIVNGIKSGISSAWSDFTTSFNQKVSSLADNARRVLQIGSPSKVFKDRVGRWIPAGMAEGIEDSSKLAEMAASDMSDKVTDAAQPDSLATSLDSSISQLQSIANLFDRIAGAFDRIANIPLPATANGQTLPANARFVQTTSSELDDTTIQTLLDGIKELISGMEGTNNRDGQAVNVYIGNDRLDSYIVRAINKNRIISGGR